MFTDPPPSERRRAKRYPLSARVRVHRGADELSLTLVNLSRSGALIHLGEHARPAWLQLGVKVDLGMGADAGTVTTVVTGTVVRIVEDLRFSAFAVQFDQYGTRERAGLDALLERAKIKNAGPPPLPT